MSRPAHPRRRRPPALGQRATANEVGAEADAPSRPRWLSGPAAGPVIFGGVALLYFAVSQLVLWLNDSVSVGASLWPAAGISLAALLLLPGRDWAWVIGAVAVGELGGDLLHGYPLWPSIGWATANSVEPLVAALLLRRFGNRRGSLVPIRQLLLFIGLAVVVAPAVGALIGGTTSVLWLNAGFTDVLPKYFIGDALGVLVVAPVLLTWNSGRSGRSVTEALTLSVSSLVLAVAIFGDHGGATATMAYLLIPFFTWTALRFGVRGVAWISLAVTMIGNWFTAVGEGPFAHVAAPAGQSVTLLQVFLGIAVATAFVLAASVSQLSDRAQVENALRHQASHDPLTGLPNRAHLAESLDAALSAGDADPNRMALLVCDIDHLKLINDTIGHSAGDELIKGVAERIRYAVRPDDLVARISGDEFVVMLTDVEPEFTVELCGRIIAAVGEPMTLDGNKRAIPSMSIGVAAGEPGASGESIFNGADAALYEAKKLGRGQSVHFDDRLRRRVREQLEIEKDLPAALTEGQIFCLHQPEIILATGELFGFESLARWQHPVRGLIGADRFIPAVEATGNAGALFDLVLAETLATQGHWATVLGFHPAVAVNLSARQLTDPQLASKVALALARAGAPVDALWLELTETGLAEGPGLEALTALKDIGVNLALDDFGSGWSSMSRLAAYPWDMLKIDRTFVARLGSDERAEHVVRAMIVMAHALGIRTVGEGVETPDQLARLTDLGCDIGQGFLFSRPVTARQAIDLVDTTRHSRGDLRLDPLLPRPAAA